MSNSSIVMCDDPEMIASNGVFEGDSPFNYYLPRLTFQLMLLSLGTLAAQVAFKPLGQTRYVANLMAGVIMGPSCLTHLAPKVFEFLFPQQGLPILDLALHLGLCFWYFLMGAQIHAGPMMKNVSAKAALIGMTSMTTPMVLAYPIALIVNKVVPEHMQTGVVPWFMGIYFLPTTVTILAGNVIDHELLGTDVGNLAMTSGIFSSVVAILPLNLWLLVITPKVEDMFYRFPLGQFLSGIGFAAFSFFVARPVISWIARRIPNEEDVKENHVCGVLLWAVGAAAVTEALGSHITYGAFMAGLILPHSALTTVVTKRLEDFNTTLLMPPFFAVVGLHTNLLALFSSGKGMTLLIILLLIYLGKIGMIALAASGSNINTNEGLVIGVLMSSRGILDILTLFFAAKSGLAKTGDQEFGILILGIIVLNMLIGPAISFLYERPMMLLHKGCRTVQELRPDMELRILACLYDHHTIPSLLSLVKATNATKVSPIYLSALHLVHATSRESTVQQQSLETGGFVRGSDAAGSLNAAFGMHKWPAWVNFSLQTKLSSYSTMPEHICKAAESGRATFIIIPFHIRRLLGSHTGVSNETVRNINLNVLEKAPCSVGVLVDMGIAGARPNVFHNVVVLFFGGSHDREALSYASRMAELEPLRLTIVRFKPAADATTKPLPISSDMTEDDLFIARFRSMAEGRRSVAYMEKMVGCGADTVTVVQGMDKTYELFIVGRNHRGAAAQMLSGLDTWSEYPELGTAGDLLVSPDISAPAVLVVQQYAWGEDVEDEVRESGHGIGHGAQTYRGYVLHDQVKASAHLPGRGSNFVSQPGGVQFDEYGWNWNLRAGF